MQISYQPWIDWLKVIGMAVIIFGHSGGDDLIPYCFNPINPKQFGVALFVFVTAFTLAFEQRRPLRVIYNRFFDVAVLGILLALGISVIQWFRIGDLNESNYLPFVFGLNVVWENAFPANPTTWYVGTYLHLLVGWAIAFRFLPRRWIVLAALIPIEIGVRAAFMYVERDFNAYMIFTSWLTVFFCGTMYARRMQSAKPAEFERDAAGNGNHVVSGSALAAGLAGPNNNKRPDASALPLRDWFKFVPIDAVGDSESDGTRAALMRGGLSVAGIIGVSLAWWGVVQTFEITKSNPFGRYAISDPVVNSLVSSCSVTLLYVTFTWLILGAVRSLPSTRLVRFLSRNTLFVFLAHMPLRDVLTPLYYPWFENGWLRQLANFVVLFVLLACVSHLLHSALMLTKVRKRIGGWLFGGGAGETHGALPSGRS
jgi:hypothetical protein